MVDKLVCENGVLVGGVPAIKDAVNGLVDNTHDLFSITSENPTEVEFQEAVDSGAKIITSINPIDISTALDIPASVSLQYIDFSGSGSVNVRTGAEVYQCEFDDINLNVDYSTDNAQILINSFINGAYISVESGFNRGGRNLNIALNKTTASPLLLATTMDNSTVTNNDINAGGQSFSVSFFGSNNLIASNDIDAGTTGIILIPIRSVNQRAKAFNNKIERNLVKDATEEGISLDVRGDSDIDGLCVASTTIDSGSASSVQFSDVFPAYQQISQYVVWQDGSRKGQQHRIIYAGSSGTGSYQLEGYTYTASDVGANVTIQLGAQGNSICFNEIRDTTLAGIKVWGGFLNTAVCDNTLVSCDIEVEALSGLTSTISASNSSPHYTEIHRNTVNNGSLLVDKVEYSGTAIEPVGISLSGNEADSVEVNVAEFPILKGEGIKANVDSREYFAGGSRTVSKFLTMTNAIEQTIFSLPLNKSFGSSAKVKVTVGATQVSATQEFTICAYRSNETTSKYGANVSGMTLYNISANSGQRNISAITVTPSVISTTTYDDTAELTIALTVDMSGTLFNESSTCNASVEVIYQTSGRGE